MRASGVHAVRQLTKVGRGLRERSRVPELASQWDGRITCTSLRLKNVTIQDYLPDLRVHHTRTPPAPR